MCDGGDTDLGVWLCLDDTVTFGVGGVVMCVMVVIQTLACGCALMTQQHLVLEG